MTDLQRILFLVAVAGAVGGVINALTSDNGFALPRRESTTGGGHVLRPGFLGNLLLGIVAALLLFGLYGPLKDVVIAGERSPTGGEEEAPLHNLSLSALAGAVLTGVGGARIITSEIDKRLLKAAAAEAAGAPPDVGKAAQIANATPASALNIAKTM